MSTLTTGPLGTSRLGPLSLLDVATIEAAPLGLTEWQPTPNQVVNYVVKITDIYGAIREEVPVKNLQYTLALNDAGSISFSLPLRHAKTVRSILEVGSSNALVYRNGQLVWGGRIWTASNDAETAEINFGGNGWFSLLMKRLIDVTVNFHSVDQLDIAWSLISTTQAKANGNLGIQRGSTALSGKLRTVKYQGIERKNIGEALQELAARNNGFDFDITPDLYWNTYYPAKGQTLEHVFELGKNIRGYSIQYDATSVENEITGIGSGDGSSTKRSVQSDAVSQRLFGLLQGVRSWKDVVRQDTLDDHTIEELRLSKDILIRPEFSIITSDPPFGSYSVGDTVGIKILDGYNQINSGYRITNITVAVADSGFEAVGLFFDDQLGG